MQITSELYKRNRQKIMQQMREGSVAIIHGADNMPRTGDLFFPYRQDSNMLYLTGIEQEQTILLLAPGNTDARSREQLFILRPDKNTETWEGRKLTNEEARDISGIETIRFVSDFEAVLSLVLYEFDSVYLPLNENPRYHSDISTLSRRFIDLMRLKYPLHTLLRLSPLLTRARLIKEPEEIAIMQKACAITTYSFVNTIPLIKPGLKEYEVEAELSYRFLKHGSRSHAFEPIIASGINTCFLHYNKNNKTLNDGDLLLLDFGAEYMNYASDCSRTIPVNGQYSPRQRDVYQAVLRTMKFAISCMVEGTTINTYHKKVCQYIEQEMIDLKLFSAQQRDEQNPAKPLYQEYFMHGTSHFIGLDTHDVGTKDIILQNNMILSCEPGIYIPAEEIGIRLETDICINSNHPIDLLKNLPIEIDDIQSLMGK